MSTSCLYYLLPDELSHIVFAHQLVTALVCPVFCLLISHTLFLFASLWVPSFVYLICCLLTSFLVCLCLPGCKCHLLWCPLATYWPLCLCLPGCEFCLFKLFVLLSSTDFPVFVCQGVSAILCFSHCCLLTSGSLLLYFHAPACEHCPLFISFAVHQPSSSVLLGRVWVCYLLFIIFNDLSFLSLLASL